MKLVCIFLLLAITVLPQPLKNFSVDRIEGFYAENNGLKWLLKKEGYSVFRDSAELYRTDIIGKKIILLSAGKRYCAVVNFDFKNDKSDYPVTVDVFNDSFDRTTYTFDAPFDLPHPAILITDGGNVLLFDPMTFKFTMMADQVTKEYYIDKDVDFEIERSFYLEEQNEKFYLLVSERPADPAADSTNVFLYTIDSGFQDINRYTLDFSVPVLLDNIDGTLVVSGAGFRNGAVYFETIISNDTGTKTIPGAFEKIVKYENGLLAKYGSTVYMLNNDFEITASKDMIYFISDIAVAGDSFYTIINDNGWKISAMDGNLQSGSLYDLSGLSGTPPRFGNTEEGLLLYDNDYTYKLNEFVRRNK